MMDLTNTHNNTNSQTQPNGSLKHHHPTAVSRPPSTVVSSYKECLKNHAASIGGHALDGCGEFMPSSSSNPTEPRSLTCAACGCHRNFHRRDTQDHNPNPNPNPNFISFYHSPPPPPHRGPGPSTSPSPSPMSSPSPPPISHHFPPSSHHLRGPITGFNFNSWNPSGKKRYRTKFSQEQKEKMQSFSEKLGWRMQKVDEGMLQNFCHEIGVSRGVFKVWMHNNKNSSRKRSLEPLDNKINASATDNNNNNPYNTNASNHHIN
ncbi:zinc-finger homeodomain protein 9 [Cajanus cajan]|uniref:zinc-finger homeodomain protein 9 n=1 Tax=Cajanus cajan TaxID=3821 RepID=UPI00098D7686|nr:zinc-finger homeodomain protein 9 [Cajanus cajan]